MYCGMAVRTALAIGLPSESMSTSFEACKAARRTWWLVPISPCDKFLAKSLQVYILARDVSNKTAQKDFLADSPTTETCAVLPGASTASENHESILSPYLKSRSVGMRETLRKFC